MKKQSPLPYYTVRRVIRVALTDGGLERIVAMSEAMARFAIEVLEMSPTEAPKWKANNGEEANEFWCWYARTWEFQLLVAQTFGIEGSDNTPMLYDLVEAFKGRAITQEEYEQFLAGGDQDAHSPGGEQTEFTLWLIINRFKMYKPQ